MAKKFLLNRKNVNVIIHSWYCLDGGYIRFPHSELDGVEYSNVDITIQNYTQIYYGIEFRSQLINITGQEPIDCELVSFANTSDGKLILNICQDWG
jgi:hypothetical protein